MAEFESQRVAAAVKGLEKIQPRRNKKKGVVTVEMMMVLKEYVIMSENNDYDKALLWFILCALLFGAFRGAELIATGVDKVTQGKTMFWNQISKEEVEMEGQRIKLLKISLVGAKEVAGNDEKVVELFETKTDICPVAALEEIIKVRQPRGSSPVAEWSSGKLMTTSYINKILKIALVDMTDWEKEPITIHCFRAALPSIMQEIGEKGEDIQMVGRWSSGAYKVYTRSSQPSNSIAKYKLSMRIREEIVKRL